MVAPAAVAVVAAVRDAAAVVVAAADTAVAAVVVAAAAVDVAAAVGAGIASASTAGDETSTELRLQLHALKNKTLVSLSDCQRRTVLLTVRQAGGRVFFSA